VNLRRADKMDAVDLRALAKTPKAWQQLMKRFPETLVRELMVERPRPDERDIEEIGEWQLASPGPVEVELATLLKDPENQRSVRRAPPDVVEEINALWGTSVRVGPQLDLNPGRYRAYAKHPGSSAKPSVLVDGVILFGVARFVAALLRGDRTMKVWDLRTVNPVSSRNVRSADLELDTMQLLAWLDQATAEGVYDLYPGYSKSADETEDYAYDTADQATAVVVEAKGLIDGLLQTPKVTLYRAVSAPSEDSLDLEYPGTYWSAFRDAAVGFGSRNGSNYLLTSVTPRSNIDLKQSLLAFFTYSGVHDADAEWELTVRDEAEVEVTAVEPLGKPLGYAAVKLHGTVYPLRQA
jgi:hypothetical protein